MNGTITALPMPITLQYGLTITHEDAIYSVEPEDGVILTRAMDCVPSKLTFKVVKDPILNFEEGDRVKLLVNGEIVFSGFVFEKTRDGKNTISVLCYDQLRYLKNKDCYVLPSMTATDFIKMVCTDYGLTVGELDNTVWKTPETPQTVFKDKSLQEMIMQLLDKTVIFTPNHAYYHIYDDGGKIMLKSFESMKTDIYIDNDVMEDVQYTTSIDKDTYNYVKIIREVPNGAVKALDNTFIAKDDANIKKWGRLQYLLIPKEKDVNAVSQAKAIISHKNRKTRDIKIKNVIGDTRVRGGSLVYINRDFGDMVVDNYMMVTSVTHTFKSGFHGMDLDLRYVENDANYEVVKDTDAEVVKSMNASKQTTSGTGAQVDTAFNANDGMVSQYGSNGCVDVAVKTGSYYNTDLKDLADRGTANVDDMVTQLESRGYNVEPYTGVANKGDILVYGDNDHVTIADGAGGCFGNSSSVGHAMRYGDVNYAWGDGEPPTKIIRMGAS